METAERESTSSTSFPSLHHIKAPPAALLQDIDSFSAAVASQRKRKRGISGSAGYETELRAAKLALQDLRKKPDKPSIEPYKNNDGFDTQASRKLGAPLPGTLRARQDRQSAFDATKVILDRWLDTVKSRREAEQLLYPLRDGIQNSRGNNSLTRAATSMVSGNGHLRFESRIAESLSLPNERTWNALTDNKKEHEKIDRKRVGHLRMEREIFIREAARAKRIKKIKSKSYRRILRRENQSLVKMESDQHASKQEISNGLAGMGSSKISHIDSNSDIQIQLCSETSKDGSQVPQLPCRLKSPTPESSWEEAYHASGIPGSSSLNSLKFMREGEKRQITQHNTEGQQDKNSHGRRIFGKTSSSNLAAQNIAVSLNPTITTSPETKISLQPRIQPTSSKADIVKKNVKVSNNPWFRDDPIMDSIPNLTTISKPEIATSTALITTSDRLTSFNSKNSTNPHASASFYHDSKSYNNPDDVSNATLVTRAFASDNVSKDMSPKRLDDHPSKSKDEIPGWGDWNNSKHRKGRLPKSASKPSSLEQTRQPKFSTSTRRSKKSSKYLSASIPYPFETREQYERSLRFPIGQEWATKHAHQDLTMPKIIIQSGKVSLPVSKPV